MHVEMHDSIAPVKVSVKHFPKEAELHKDFDMWTLKLRRGLDEITIFFRDLDNLIDMTKSLALRVTQLRVDQEQGSGEAKY